MKVHQKPKRLENLLIKFDVDAKELDFGIKALEALGKVDKKVADEFRAANASFQAQKQAIAEIGKQTKETANEVKALSEATKRATIDSKASEETTKKSTNAFQALRQEIRNLKAQIIDAEAAGDNGLVQKLTKQAAVATDKMGDLNKSIKNLSSDTRGFDALLGAARGIAGGFAVAQGAAALFGNQNKDLEKTIIKLQGALALLNGLTEIQNVLQADSAVGVAASAAKRVLLTGVTAGMTTAETIATVATNAFNVSIKALLGPIGLILAAIGAAGTAFAIYSSNVKAAADEVERTNRITRIGAEALDLKQKEILDNIKKDIELKKAQGKSAAEVYNAEIQLIKTTIAFLIQKQNATSDPKAFKDAQNQINLLKKDLLIIEANFNNDILEGKKKLAEKEKEIQKQIADDKKNLLEKEFSEELKQINEHNEKKRQVSLARALFDLDSERKFFQEQEAIGRAAEKAANDRLDKKNEEDLEKEKERIRQLKEVSLAGGQDVANALFEINKNNRAAETEAQLSELDIRRQNEFAAIDAQTAKLLENKNLTENQRRQIEDAAAKKKKAADDKIRAEEKKVKVEAFQAEKRAAILQATINTALAIIKTYATLGFPIGIPAAIAAGIAGAAQVAVITSQPTPKFEEGTQSSPEGPAWVGEKGSELMVDPGGKMMLSPNKPTLTYLKKGTKVLTAAETAEKMNILNDMSLSSLYIDPAGSIKENKGIDEYAMTRAVSRGLKGSTIHIENHDQLAQSIVDKMKKNNNFF